MVDLALLLLCLLFTLLGCGLGTLSGVAPGIHVNTLALFLLLASPLLLPLIGSVCTAMGTAAEWAALPLACTIIAATVVHSFADFLPSIFLGAPDEESCTSVLPGHRLLLQGEGLKAVMAACKGSLVGALLGLLLAVPLLLLLGPLGLDAKMSAVTPWLMLLLVLMLILAEGDSLHLRPVVDARHGSVAPAEAIRPCLVRPFPGTTVVLVGTMSRRQLRNWLRCGRDEFQVLGARTLGLVQVTGVWRLRQRRWTTKATAAGLILLSGALGLIAMEGRPPPAGVWDGMGSSLLLPLLTGLFGMPAMIESLKLGMVPEQKPLEDVDVPLRPCAEGFLAGALAALLPGMTSTSGAAVGGMISRERGEELEFIAMVSAVGTAATMVAVLGLLITGSGGTGSLIVVQQVMGPSLLAASGQIGSFPMAVLLCSALLATFLGYWITISLGGRFAAIVGGADMRRSNLLILAFTIILVAAMCGLPGLVLLAACTLVGLLPPALGVGRVHLTGCLLIPILLALIDQQGYYLEMLEAFP
jgi:putative membrane protein